MTATTKLTGLSDLTIKALEQTLAERITAVTASTMTLEGTARELHVALALAMDKMPDRRHHPYASLHSAQRRLMKLAKEQKEEQPEEQIVANVDNEVKVDPNALFLVGMHQRNMFEERRDPNNRPAGYRCKVCNAVLGLADQAAHYEQHKQDKSNHATEQIRARKENDMASKTPKTTPAQQGFPAVYLSEDGSKFSPPGADAVAKSDLIHAFHGWDKPTALHTFTQEEAAKLLSARGWNGFAIKAKEAREAKEARAAAKAAEKATAVKAKAEAKKSKAKAKPAADVEVTPDPKPTRATRSPRSRKVGS